MSGDPIEEIERRLRERGVLCLSIRQDRRGYRVNYRCDDAHWQEGKRAKTLRGAFEVHGFLSPAPDPTDDDMEGLLG